MSLNKVGSVAVGDEVAAQREDGDDEEYERCTIRSVNAKAPLLELDFGDGFIRKNVPVEKIKFIGQTKTPASKPVPTVAAELTRADRNQAHVIGLPVPHASTQASDGMNWQNVHVGLRTPMPPAPEPPAHLRKAKPPSAQPPDSLLPPWAKSKSRVSYRQA